MTALLWLVLPLWSAPQGGAAGGDRLIVAADVLHVGDGTLLQRAVVEIASGRISAVRQGEPPSGAIHVPGAELTPGLVDACSYMGVDSRTVEQSRENTAGQRVAATATLDSPSFRRAMEAGVTAAFLSPDSLNVFGGVGSVVKTWGGRPANLFAPPDSAARPLDFGGALKLTIADDPTAFNYPPRGGPPDDLFGRRPTTRMGTVWTIRKEFYRALELGGRRASPAAADPDLAVLRAVLDGRMPVRVLARRSHDVQTALRLAAEFGWKKLVIEEGTEAHRCAALLAEAGVPVVCGPLYDEVSRSIAAGYTLEEWREFAAPPAICCERAGEPHGYEDETGLTPVGGLALELLGLTLPRYGSAGLLMGRRQESEHATPALPALLSRAGVPCALGAAEGHDGPARESSVIHQARTAARWGVPAELALQMVTGTAASLCGAAEELGTVAQGKAADLVLWSGPPLRSDARPLLVIVDGRVALDRRPVASD